MRISTKVGVALVAVLALSTAACSRSETGGTDTTAAATSAAATSAAATSAAATGDSTATGGSEAPGSAAGGDTPDGTGKTIGLAVANLQADFFNQIKIAAEEQAAATGATLIVSDAGGDSDKQVSQIQDFITSKVDAIIYIPAGASAADVPVNDAKAAGIPVVTVDRNPDGAPGNTFIATDSVAAARELGEWVIEQKGGESQYAILQGQLGTTPQVDRSKGWDEAMADAPGMNKVAEDTANWAQDAALSLAQNMLTANPEIDVIWGQADAMAQGAAEAVRLANLDHDVLVVGFDGDTTALPDVLSGKIAATMVQQVKGMGRLAVDSAIQLTEGETLPAEQLQEAFLATKDNVQQYITEHP